MVKNYSFYQFIMTVRGRKDDKGVFAEQILKTLPFQNTKMILIHYLNILRHIANSLPMSVFDDLYDDYTEWLKF